MPGTVVLSMNAREAVVLDTIGRTRIRPSLETGTGVPSKKMRFVSVSMTSGSFIPTYCLYSVYLRDFIALYPLHAKYIIRDLCR